MLLWWERDWSTNSLRRGRESWDCSAWRGGGSGGSYRCVQTADRRAKRRWNQTQCCSQCCPSDKARGNRPKLKHRKNPFKCTKICLTVRGVKPCKMLPREVVGSPILEILETQGDVALNNLLFRPLAFSGVVVSNTDASTLPSLVILWPVYNQKNSHCQHCPTKLCFYDKNMPQETFQSPAFLE